MGDFFSGKVVWVTGASSGIGRALVKQLSPLGCFLVLSAREGHRLGIIAAEEGLTEANSLILPFDLGAMPESRGLMGKIIEKFSRIDILINNGGVSQRSRVLETDAETERRLMEINYFSHVAISKQVLSQFIRQGGGGNIVVMSSIVGKFGYYLRSTYSASKHALQGYFESLRLEYEDQGIRVLIVYPGKIDTEMPERALGQGGKLHGKEEQSHKEGMAPEECAAKIIKALELGRQDILIGRGEIWAVGLKAWAPFLFRRVIRKGKGREKGE